MMLTGDAGREPLPLFRAAFDELRTASRPSNQATGEVARDLGQGDGAGALNVLTALDEMIRQEFG